tara:strand:+ start:61 stop:432 length:372 start_codon:yes stop_codon:yes gene_type:complete
MDKSRLYGRQVQRPEHAPHVIYEPDPELVLISNQPVKVMYQVGYNAPFSSGGKSIFPSGEKVKVEHHVKGAQAVACKVIDYKRLEKVIVSERERNDEKYNGYGLLIFLDDLENYFDEIYETVT